MRVLRSCTVCLLALLLLLCGGCAAGDDFNAGEELSAEELAALKAQLEAAENESPKQENNEMPQDGTVFWLDGGKVYHVTAACYHIAKKENVRQGTLAEAAEAGKERPCSACFAD